VITASHFRTEAGDEVDLVLETRDGRVAGFEIKAGTRIKDPDLNGLRLLRDCLGDRFAGGFVRNLGDLAYRKESKIAVMPLSALWSLTSRLFHGFERPGNQSALGAKLGANTDSLQATPGHR
jgi:predicted AAA+ superfamily ATPase